MQKTSMAMLAIVALTVTGACLFGETVVGLPFVGCDSVRIV